MNRRQFFGSLLAGVALMVAPKVALPAPAPLLTLTRAPINLREMHRRMLGRWLAERIDQAIFDALTTPAR